MLRLRPYNKNDAEIIMSWIKGENAFYKWTAGVLGEYPISAEQFNTVSNLMAFTAIDDNEIVGFFTMRRPNEFFEELRFGFVIVDSKKRGQGYGKNMLKLGLNQRVIAGNAQFAGIAAGRGVRFTTGLLLLGKGLGMRETPIRPHSWH